MLLLFNLPEFFSSEEFVACTRVFASGLPKKTIRTRLNNWRIFNGKPPLTFEKYRSMKSTVRYSFTEFGLTLRPAKKFSGWVRHQNDQGSLRREPVLPEPHPSDFTDIVEFDLFMILSVGKVTLLNTSLSLSPDDDSKESKQKFLIK